MGEAPLGQVAPFLRWAEAITAHLPAADRIGAMRAILPSNLIGRHAVTHLELVEHFSGHLAHLNIWNRPVPFPPARPGRSELDRELRRVIAAGEVGAFNRHMKRFPCGPDGEHWHANPCRTLAGVHDVDALLSDCYLHRRREADRAAWAWSRLRRPWLAGLHAGTRCTLQGGEGGRPLTQPPVRRPWNGEWRSHRPFGASK